MVEIITYLFIGIVFILGPIFAIMSINEWNEDREQEILAEKKIYEGLRRRDKLLEKALEKFLIDK